MKNVSRQLQQNLTGTTFLQTAANIAPDTARDRQDTPNIDARGTSGTEIYSGYFDEEYLDKLLAERGIEVFDQMRRSDGHVKMLLNAVKNPIKSAKWVVQPASEDDQDMEIAEFIKFVLMEDIGTRTKKKTFRAFIEEALTVIEFGHVVFERVHKVVQNSERFGNYLGLADLGFRHQRSLLEWRLFRDGSIDCLRQLVNGDLGVDTVMLGENLIVVSMDKEGDNYEGISMLRPLYGSYFRKNIYRKLQAIGIERASKGVPIATVDSNSTQATDYEDSVDNIQEIIDRLSAHEMSGAVFGAGVSVTSLKIEHDSEKVQEVINSENSEMSGAFLANFLQLGQNGNGGSFSLGTDLSDIFLNGIQYIADNIAEPINIDLIPELVRARFGEQARYPRLVALGINDKAGKELAEIVTQLLDRDAIQLSVKLQRFLHERFGLPELDEKIAELDNERFRTQAPEPEPPQAPEVNLSDLEKKNCCGGGDTMNRHSVYTLQEEEREEFPISARIEDAADVLNELMRTNLRRRADLMLEEVRNIVNSGRGNVRDRVLALEVPRSTAYETALTSWVSDTIDTTFNQTLEELNIERGDITFQESLATVPDELREKLTALIALTAQRQDQDIQTAVFFSFNDNLDTLENDDLFEELDRQVDAYFERGTITTSSVNVSSNVVNSTREEVFLIPEVAEEIDSFIFTNPDPISLICRTLNGKVLSKEEFENTPFTPPLHHNCKSYFVVQTAGAPDNLPITGLEITGSATERERILRTKTL